MLSSSPLGDAWRRSANRGKRNARTTRSRGHQTFFPHIIIGARDLDRLGSFYDAALAAVG